MRVINASIKFYLVGAGSKIIDLILNVKKRIILYKWRKYMFNLGTKVQFKVENMEYIGTVDMLQVNPVTGETRFVVTRRNGESYSLSVEELNLYAHSHISNAFNRSFHIEEE